MNERGRKKVTCEQCGKSFVSFEDLTLHQSTEKGHITPNYLSKPTSVEVRTVHQSCIRLNWSPPMGIAVHQYYIQSYNPGKQEWSSLGVVHPQMPSFIINSDMLSDLCKPVAEIGICAVNVQQQCGPRYVVQFQKIPIQVNGMGVLEYKLEKTHWQKLDWKIHHSAPYQLKNLKTSGPVGTPEKLAARQTANKDILLSWCEPGVNRDEDQDLAISSHGNFTGYSIFISKVNRDTWACVKNLNEEVYSTVIPHENIPELSEYQVGIKAKKGFHTGPMAILCFHHMKPDGSVFVNELEPCKTCNALKTKSVRSFVTKGTGINRMEVDSDDDLQVDEDVFCLEKSSKTDVFQTANHDLKRAMGRKAVFFFANHFYQPVTELPISISNVHSDGCGKIRLKVSISQDLWRTLNTTLDDQGKPLYHVFLRMGRHYGDKFEDEIPECLISVNKRIVKVQVANGLSPCKDGPVDITGSLHPNNNNIILTIKPGCEQPYMVYIHMVRKLGPKATVRRLLKERVIPQSRTKRLIKNYLTADRNSIKYCSYKVKLTCPITQGRLETPCRGDLCKHIQCMEAGTVIQMNETKKGRRCLLCKEPYNKLDIDGLFLEILQSVPSSVTEVEFNPEGEWKTVLNTDESGPSVSIDDDVVMPQLAEVLNDHTEVDSECEAIAGFHKDVQGKTDDVPQVKIENVEGESWSTENGGWYLSQYGLELKDNDVELVDAEVRQDIGMQFATESNVNHCADQTDGMICDNNSPNLKVEDFSYSKDDNEAEDMSIQNIDIFPHKKGSAQDTSTSQIMIEDQESGKRVYLYENILSEDGDEFLSCESELEKRTSESLEGDHNVNNYDALGLAFNFTQATSSSQNSNVEETVTMDTSWNGREIIEVDKDLCTTEDMSLSDDLKEPSDRRSPHQRRRKCPKTKKTNYQHKKSYEDKALENAVSAVLQKGMSIRKAALEFGIPSSTLNERCHQTGPRNEEYQHKKTYGDEAFENAVSAVLQKGMSIRKAALEFGIPPTTLHERLKRKDPTDSIARKVGWQKDFSNNQEECLAELLLYMAAHGLPATRKMLRDRVKELLQISGTACRVNIEMGPSNHWLRGFVKRHLLFDHMAETRPPLDPPESIKEFFDMYEKTIVECGLQNKDDQIFNCDGTRWTEKSFKLCPKTGHQLEMKTGTGSHVIAHMCISAGGRFLPSMLIYKESLPLAPIDGVPDTWLITASDTGLINSEIFSEWFTKIFIPNCGMERPVLLVMNNLYNPVSIPTMLAAKENSIILFGVPGNSTHILHPLDVEIFGELQATVHDISSSQLDASKRVVIEKTEYPAILSQAIDQTAPESVQHAFEVTGLCPVNREAIDMSKLAQVKDEPEGRMDCAGPMVENEREVIDMNLYLASDTVFGLCDEPESERNEDDRRT